MNVSAWAIRNPIPSILLFVVLTALGLYSFQKLPITFFPTIDVPQVSLTITDSGVAPTEMETSVTRLVEDAISALSGVDELSSTISDGVSTTSVDFELGVPIDRAVADVRDAVAKIRSDLPATIDEPVIERVDVESEAVVTYAAADKAMTAEELSWFVDDVVIRRLRGVPGVGRIDRVGGVAREIQVQLDPDRLLALGITASQVNTQLSATHLDLSGGRSEVDGRERAVTMVATTGTVEELARLAIALPDGSTARLGELATVVDGFAEPRSFATLDGGDVVSFSVYRARGASDVTVAEEVADALRQLSVEHGNMRFTRIDDSITQTLGNYHAALSTLAEGAALAVVVVFLFLRDWRATVIAAVALPLSAIPTFWAMDLLGFSLNILSLLAITLVTGILVDDAIVEIENIVRHGRSGKKPYRAAIDASDEIGLAVMAISATIIAVFVPVGFMSGVVGQYFREFGLTVAIAVFFSLLVARLITPLMAAYLLRAHPVRHAPQGRAMRFYLRLLRLSMAWRWMTLGTAFALFAVSIWSAQFLPSEFIPPEDNGRMSVSIELPPGATLAETRETAGLIALRVGALDEARLVFIQGGANAAGLRDVRRAAVRIDFGPAAERARSTDVLEPVVADILRTVPDIRFEILNDRGGRDVSFAVLGKDGEVAGDAAAAILEELAASSFAVGASSTAAAARPELQIRPLAERAADAGISPQIIADTIRVSTVGASDSDLPEFVEDGRRIPIRLQLADWARNDIGTLRSLRIPSLGGPAAPLSDIATITLGTSVANIDRFDRERRIEISFDAPAGMTAGEGLDAIQSLATVRALPEGVRLQATGDSDDQGDVFAGFATAMTAGLGLVMIVLILLFGSVLTPLTILVTLPLSVGGVVAALMATATPISLPVVIGVLMLMGIVTKNAIMLVDFAVEREKAGVARRTAMIEAAAERVRPILMTTLAMVAGMIPAAMASGDGGEFRAPMAIAVIGGLIASTILSLVVVPTLHCLVGDVGALFHRLWSRVGPAVDTVETEELEGSA
ncbi:efflux RND transporter permease subunit [Aurantimonas endophytica]|uniref:Multidrug efflux pump subunit AcrB n=1 Tax=Aurantimonas endophytica TaxID=1522175 RepID=A0A7W6MND9_9HYPH|nr:efflux RND transporter permease subunit [Aurantimonas endophytica]MBB4001860.1 multidrug efflux pump subunit AcrB [Aurantimonas endophytica]MCO6402504.1 MMPL family transporter [Aurantimonas endophytica]